MDPVDCGMMAIVLMEISANSCMQKYAAFKDSAPMEEVSANISTSEILDKKVLFQEETPTQTSPQESRKEGDKEGKEEVKQIL